MHMQLAMGIAAFLCVFIGMYTPYLYGMLPYAAVYKPYTAYHVSESMQILLFTALGFFIFLKKLTPEPVISLDMDWFYRMGGRVFQLGARKGMDYLSVRAHKYLGGALPRSLNIFSRSGPARLSLLLIRPLWYLTGVKVQGPEGAEKRFTETFSQSLFTIGSSAVFIIIVLMVLLFFIA